MGRDDCPTLRRIRRWFNRPDPEQQAHEEVLRRFDGLLVRLSEGVVRLEEGEDDDA